MKSAEFDIACLEISEHIEAYIKYVSNPDVDSVVNSIMPHISEKFNPDKKDYFRLLSAAKRICGDILKKKKNE